MGWKYDQLASPKMLPSRAQCVISGHFSEISWNRPRYLAREDFRADLCVQVGWREKKEHPISFGESISLKATCGTTHGVFGKRDSDPIQQWAHRHDPIQSLKFSSKNKEQNKTQKTKHGARGNHWKENNNVEESHFTSDIRTDTEAVDWSYSACEMTNTCKTCETRRKTWT